MNSTTLRLNSRLVLAIVAAQTADLATFLFGVARVGIHHEQNPLVRNLYITSGPTGPILLKVAMLGLVIFLLVRANERYRSRGALAASAVAVLIGLVGVWANVTTALA
jgi:hypothetical protein